MTTPPPLVNTEPTERRNFVKGQYERLWDATYDKAVRLLDAGETELARLHLMMRRDFGPDFQDPYLRAKYEAKEAQRRTAGFIYDRQLIAFKEVESRVSTLMIDAVKMQEIVNAAGPDCGRVIETGSGWGKTLFNVWLHGGPLRAEYHALELTDAGRKATVLVRDRAAPAMDIRPRYFNYYEPDFGFLTESKPTVVYTHHSLEQMPEIGREFFEAMIEIPGFRCCVHLEPVGFQVPGLAFLDPPATEEQMRRIDVANRKFSEKRNQNMNLVPILNDMQAEGLIRITKLKKYFCSTILENATTLIIWEKA